MGEEAEGCSSWYLLPVFLFFTLLSGRRIHQIKRARIINETSASIFTGMCRAGRWAGTGRHGPEYVGTWTDPQSISLSVYFLIPFPGVQMRPVSVPTIGHRPHDGRSPAQDNTPVHILSTLVHPYYMGRNYSRSGRGSSQDGGDFYPRGVKIKPFWPSITLFSPPPLQSARYFIHPRALRAKRPPHTKLPPRDLYVEENGPRAPTGERVAERIAMHQGWRARLSEDNLTLTC